MTVNERQMEFEGHVIRYGRNAEGNTHLIEDADGADMWFHVDEYASAHVICESSSPHAPYPASVVRFCANFCVERTLALKRQGLKKVYVIYTPVSNLKLGKVPGEVEIVDEKMVRRIRVEISSPSSSTTS